MAQTMEQLAEQLTAQELSVLRALLNGEEYSRVIDDWEESFNESLEDY